MSQIFATVGNEKKKAFLAEQYGLNPAHIFNSRDSTFLQAVLSATSSKGVDVVLNSLTGEMLHASFEACAAFGRFVEVGKRDIIDHGSLDMATFGRNVSFLAFDLSNFYFSGRPTHHRLWQNLLTGSMQLIRSGTASSCSPLETFKASEIVSAFRYFSNSSRTGKVAVSFEDASTPIKVVCNRYETFLHAKKCYLMVGCLGGLGRALSKWMISRGARYFVFLSRSGLDKHAARTLVHDLREQGAAVEVVCGDVRCFADVESAIQAAQIPIGGVVQAAMSLSESLWSIMSSKDWHHTVDPKVQGTWNLHNALRHQARDKQLDFFLMTSSISGTAGTATLSNYCAANAFLDSFARFRNGIGLPAVSVGLGMISEVGYLHEHPDIEALMRRKGIKAYNEEELLQIIDMALSPPGPEQPDSQYDELLHSHLLTGVEFSGVKEQRDLGFDGDNHVLMDPRASLYSAAFARSNQAADTSHSASRNEMPEAVSIAMQSRDRVSLQDTIRGMVAKKVSNLILLPLEKLRPNQALGDFGIDSMLAAEFRAFLFQSLKVDVPFVTLLDRSATVDSLTQLIADQLMAL